MAFWVLSIYVIEFDVLGTKAALNISVDVPIFRQRITVVLM